MLQMMAARWDTEVGRRLQPSLVWYGPSSRRLAKADRIDAKLVTRSAQLLDGGPSHGGKCLMNRWQFVGKCHGYCGRGPGSAENVCAGEPSGARPAPPDVAAGILPGSAASTART
jgi:hypothetical protein